MFSFKQSFMNLILQVILGFISLKQFIAASGQKQQIHSPCLPNRNSPFLCQTEIHFLYPNQNPTQKHHLNTTFQPKTRVQVTSDPKYCSDSLRCSKSLVDDSVDSCRKIGWQYVPCSAQKGPASYTPASPGGLFLCFVLEKWHQIE